MHASGSLAGERFAILAGARMITVFATKCVTPGMPPRARRKALRENDATRVTLMTKVKDLAVACAARLNRASAPAAIYEKIGEPHLRHIRATGFTSACNPNRMRYYPLKITFAKDEFSHRPRPDATRGTLFPTLDRLRGARMRCGVQWGATGVSFHREAAEHARSLDCVCPGESNGKAPKSDSCDVRGKYIADADTDVDVDANADADDNGEISRAQSRSRFGALSSDEQEERGGQGDACEG